MVVIHNDGAPRAFWKLGRVKELFTSKDGEVRGGAVEVLSGGKRLSLLRRLIQCLTPLEVIDENRVSPAAWSVTQRKNQIKLLIKFKSQSLVNLSRKRKVVQVELQLSQLETGL